MINKKIIKQLNIEFNALPIPDVLERVRAKSKIIVTQKIFTVNKAATRPRKKLWLRVVPGFMAVVLIFAVTVANFISPLTAQAYTTVTVDINPSFEVTYDNNETIVEVTTINNDAVALLQGLELVGQKFTQTINNIFDKAVEQGFLNASALSNLDNAVMISVKNQNQNKKQEERQKIQLAINNYFTNESIPFNYIYEEVDEIEDELKDELEILESQFENNEVRLSVTKYNYIKQIIARFPTLAGQEEELAQMNMTELYKLLRESEDHMASGQDLLDDILDGHLDSWAQGQNEDDDLPGEHETEEGDEQGNDLNNTNNSNSWLSDYLRNLFGTIYA
jgi:hypothetical protein